MKDALTAEWEAKIEEMLRYATASERLRAMLPIITLTLQELTELAELDGDLLPELKAAGDLLRDTSAVLVRAHTFASERMRVKLGLDQ